MRRAPIAVVATAAGLLAVVGLHGQTSSVLSTREGSTASRAPSTPTPRGKGSSGPGGPSSGTSPVGTSPSGTSPLGASRAHILNGPQEQFGYGSLVVRVTVSGSKITALSVPYLRVAESYSATIAAEVIPILNHEVLSAQSARINGVSGATYTSEAYDLSLQSALDQLHLR
jgi:hypothetical protein